MELKFDSWDVKKHFNTLLALRDNHNCQNPKRKTTKNLPIGRN